MADKNSGWACTADVSVVAETNTTATVRVICYWKNQGWRYAMNGVSAWVYCNGTAVCVKDNGSIDTQSNNQAAFEMGRHDFVINKTTSVQNIPFCAKITSTSSYASGTKWSGDVYIGVAAKPSYTVSYNANGGSGAPGNQTKTYGVNLTLSTTKPTRTNYNFKGWATSASGGVVYASGATYSTNSAVTLYAVWELAYVKPRINSFTAQRCDSAGTAGETGTYVKASFTWATDKTVSAVKIQYKLQTATSWTDVSVTASGTSGTVNQTIGGGNISTENSYHVRAYVTDSGGTTYSTIVSVGTVKFPIDVRKGGKGVAIGKVAETDNLFDVGMPTMFRDDARLNKNSGEAAYYAKRTDTNIEVFFGVGSGGTNHGVYSETLGKWIVYADPTTSNIRLNGNADSVKTSGTYNRGAWNVPTTGAVTQITDNSGNQHSVIVGLKSDGKTRLYGMDLIDNDTSPVMRLYAGSRYLEINSGSNSIVTDKGSIRPGVQIYDNGTGNNGTLTLTESANNFNFLEIYFKHSKGYGSQKIHAPNGKTISLMFAWHTTESGHALVQYVTKTVNISGTTITPYSYSAHNARADGGYWIANDASTNNLSIVRVIGYR